MPIASGCSPTGRRPAPSPQSPVSIEQLAKEGRLTELPAIGKTLAEKIETLIETGSIPSADKLKAKFPATLVEVTRVPGLGAKTARRIYDEIGVENLTELKEAAEQGRISAIRGLGPKTEENILASLEGVTEDGLGERLLLSNVLPDRGGDPRRPARARGGEPDRDRRLGAALDRDLQGPRPDRDHRRRPGPGGGARHARALRGDSRGAAMSPQACSPTPA